MINEEYMKLMQVLFYYESFLFESKKEDIDIIKNSQLQNCVNYLKDFEKAKKVKVSVPIINYLYEVEYGDKAKKEKYVLKILNKWEKLEMMIKEHTFKKFPKYEKKILVIFFQDSNNKETLLKIFNQNDIEYFINQNINYTNKEIRNPYILKYESCNNVPKKYNKKAIDEIDIIKKNIINYQEIASIFLDNKCCFEYSKRNLFKEPISIYFITKNNDKIKLTNKQAIDNFYFIEESNNFLFNNYKKLLNHLKLFEKKINNYNIDESGKIVLEFKKKDKNCFNNYFNFECNYLIEKNMKNYNFKDINIFINGINMGFNNMTSYINSLNRQNFENSTIEHTIINIKIDDLNLTFYESNDYFKDNNIIISNIWNYYNNKNENLVFKTNEGFYKGNIKGYFIKLEKLESIEKNCNEIEKNCIIYNKNIMLTINKEIKQKESEWTNSEVIDRNIISFIINKSQSKNEKIIYIYDIKINQIKWKYNFSSSSKNNIILLKKDEKNNKILLIPNKNDNKNEIILLDISSLENLEKKKFPSFSTYKFEIFTLCQIMGKGNNEIFNQSTEFFYAYGFDHFDKKWKILLYQLFFDYSLNENQIILIGEVKAKNGNLVEEEILFIIQSEENGKIQIFYKNGRCSLFSPPKFTIISS